MIVGRASGLARHWSLPLPREPPASVDDAESACRVLLIIAADGELRGAIIVSKTAKLRSAAAEARFATWGSEVSAEVGIADVRPGAPRQA